MCSELRVITARTGAKMNRQGYGLLVGAMGAVLVVAGCQTGSSNLSGEDGGAVAADAQGIVTAEKDIESPGVFNMTGEALWDGRPSLGGVWVAHSSVKEPERVMIRNTKNGKSVVGALFRRERENPGPSVQVSSDAAEALGMLAGQPASLTIVALRRQELDLTSADEVTPETEAAAAEAAQKADEKTAAGSATPAPDAAAPVGAATDVADDTVADEAAVADDAAADATEMAPEPKKNRGLFGGLFKRKPKPEDAMTAPVADAATGGAIDAAPLDPVVGAATAGIEAAEAKQAAQPAASASDATLKRAYVQIGIFSTEANATRAVGQMEKAGMTARVVPDQSNGKTYWRVIVGPASSVADRDALAAKVKGLGYPDAYPVSK